MFFGKHSPTPIQKYNKPPPAASSIELRLKMEEISSTITGNEARGSLKPEPTEVYQEAALTLRYTRITAMTARKLERTMTLLHLKPCHLIECGLAHRNSLEQGWYGSDEEGTQRSPSTAANSGNSARTTASCVQVRMVHS